MLAHAASGLEVPHTASHTSLQLLFRPNMPVEDGDALVSSSDSESVPLCLLPPSHPDNSEPESEPRYPSGWRYGTSSEELEAGAKGRPELEVESSEEEEPLHQSDPSRLD
ncbi:hypothetical protein Hypma_001672 [Hypsizygus marmoreus]|uniref:Uncharacterized protein n=1 Tax=Hypsizygus marmoreus TaxID=39966 RepID=A0A369JCG0_HYPMA|nr:hypothetical protein Hypma_001672 [Hypsizygus marmoreus]